MKYQCTICGQIIDNGDRCPICGSDSSKIISVNENTEESITYRCLSCGRVFENKDLCPYCNGADLYDLTNDRLFNRNKVHNEDNFNDDSNDVDIDLVKEFSSSTKNDFGFDETFEDKEIILEKEPVVEEDDSNLIKDDVGENATITKVEDDVIYLNNNESEVKEELKNESLEESNDNFEDEIKEEKVENHDVQVDNDKPEIKHNESAEKNDEIKVEHHEVKTESITKAEEESDLTKLKTRRIDLTKDLIIKLFLLKENNDYEKELLKDELNILKQLLKDFDNSSIDSILDEKIKLNKEIFKLEKDSFNGFIDYLEESKRGK